MFVYRGFLQKAVADTVLTLGNFDGVHLGHRALLAQLMTSAKENNLVATALTFEPHPRDFFAPESAPTRLSALREKLELIAEEGVTQTYVCRFNACFAALSAEDFIEHILVDSLRVKHLIIGDDFRFGAGRRGNFTMLHEAGNRFGFKIDAMNSVMLEGERVSSSAVRSALATGKMDRAAQLLGRPYSIDGRVIHGDQLGRQLGFATANIRIKHDKPPLLGVFAVEVRGVDGKTLKGVANLGFRPSINKAVQPLLEVHLFDFAHEIYGTHLNVRFLHKLRDEMKFPDFNALKAQIATDVTEGKAYFHHRDTEAQR
ncbi:MAG: bifunctional riboflavin kinase/FAD synthetase [Betaproteobacteria bacterium]